LDIESSSPAVTAAIAFLCSVALHKFNTRKLHQPLDTVAITSHTVLHAYHHPHTEKFSKSPLPAVFLVLQVATLVGLFLSAVFGVDSLFDVFPNFDKAHAVGGVDRLFWLPVGVLITYLVIFLVGNMLQYGEAVADSIPEAESPNSFERRVRPEEVKTAEFSSFDNPTTQPRAGFRPGVEAGDRNGSPPQEKHLPHNNKTIAKDESWLPAGSYTIASLPPPPDSVRKILADVGFDDLVKRLDSEPLTSRTKIKLKSRQRNSFKVISRIARQ
jgi:hypothetical protein